MIQKKENLSKVNAQRLEVGEKIIIQTREGIRIVFERMEPPDYCKHIRGVYVRCLEGEEIMVGREGFLSPENFLAERKNYSLTQPDASESFFPHFTIAPNGIVVSRE